MSTPAPSVSPYGLIKPFVWLAALSFLLGFSSFMLAGANSVAQAHERARAVTPVFDLTPPDWSSNRRV